MVDICCGLVRENEASLTPCEPTSRAARRRRMEIRRFKFVPGLASTETGADGMGANKKQKQLNRGATSPFSRLCQNEVENCRSDHCSIDEKKLLKNGKSSELKISKQCSLNLTLSPSILLTPSIDPPELFPKFRVASVCGRRRDMEDAVAIHSSFCRKDHETTTGLHYFGVYDRHGCSHVAVNCKERLHELVTEEVESKEEW